MPLSPVQTSSVTAALRELASVAGCWTASRAPTIKSGWTTSTKSVSGTAVPRRTERTRWIRCRSSHLDIWWRRSTCCRRFQTSSSTASPARMLQESGPVGRSLYCCRLRFGVVATLRSMTGRVEMVGGPGFEPGPHGPELCELSSRNHSIALGFMEAPFLGRMEPYVEAERPVELQRLTLSFRVGTCVGAVVERPERSDDGCAAARRMRPK